MRKLLRNNIKYSLFVFLNVCAMWIKCEKWFFVQNCMFFSLQKNGECFVYIFHYSLIENLQSAKVKKRKAEKSCADDFNVKKIKKEKISCKIWEMIIIIFVSCSVFCNFNELKMTMLMLINWEEARRKVFKSGENGWCTSIRHTSTIAGTICTPVWWKGQKWKSNYLFSGNNKERTCETRGY